MHQVCTLFKLWDHRYFFHVITDTASFLVFITKQLDQITPFRNSDEVCTILQEIVSIKS